MASVHAATNGTYGGAGQYNDAIQAVQNGTSSEKTSVEKDQIGWYFVERYYNLMAEHPDQLHLFYNKKSLFTTGNENQRVPVSVGRSQIQKDISQMDFKDVKVAISNVDTQATEGSCILVHVIGDMLKNETKVIHRFIQVFVLAEQLNGYYVLNSIFRFLNSPDEVQENQVFEDDAPVVPEEPVAEIPKAEEEPQAAVLDADVVDKKLEAALASEPAVEAPTTNGNGVSVEVDKADEAPVAATKPEGSPTPEVVEKQVEEETEKEVEVPHEPSPTPAAAPVAVAPTPPKVKPAAPAPPAAPAKPMTWASRIAQSAAATAPPKPAPVVPTKAATPPVQARAAPAPAPAVPAPQQSQVAPATSGSAEKEPGWQTAGGEQKRQAKPQSVSGPVAGKEDCLGYVRNVSEKVNVDELRAALAKCGELVYFDVNRSKNCAFVEFADSAGYKKAAEANPHIVNGEQITVEPRRPKTTAYGGREYSNNNRGAMNGRGRGNFDGRQGSQSGRGNFVQRGRGGPSGGALRGGAGQKPAGTAA